MGSGERFVRALFEVLILVGFIWFFLIGTLESTGEAKRNTPLSLRGETMTNTPLSSSQSKAGSLNSVKVIGVDKLHVHPNSDLNFMSKRRVPNGPDPIHNRRAGNSGRPPGQA